MKALLQNTARLLLIVMLLSVPLGCATSLGRRSAQNQTQNQEALPADSQITLKPLEGQTSSNERSQPDAAGDRRSEIEQAIKANLAKLDQGADPGEIYHQVARLSAENDDFENAELYYRRAMRHLPPNAEFATDYGYCLALLGRFDEAEFVLRKTIQLDPEAMRARNNLGLVLAATDRRDEALEAFTQAGADPIGANANLEFATAWRDRTSRSAAISLRQDSSDSDNHANRLASTDQPSQLKAAPSGQRESERHQLTSFTGLPHRAQSPSE